MLILKCLFVLLVISLAGISLFYTRTKYCRVEVPESVYERAINWILELESKVYELRQTESGIIAFMDEMEQWQKFIYNIPEPEKNGLTLIKGKKKL